MQEGPSQDPYLCKEGPSSKTLPSERKGLPKTLPFERKGLPMTFLKKGRPLPRPLLNEGRPLPRPSTQKEGLGKPLAKKCKALTKAFPGYPWEGTRSWTKALTKTLA